MVPLKEVNMRPSARTAHPSARGIYSHGYYGTAYYYRGHGYYAVRAGGARPSTSTAGSSPATRR